jgi:hypothetical protein
MFSSHPAPLLLQQDVRARTHAHTRTRTHTHTRTPFHNLVQGCTRINVVASLFRAKHNRAEYAAMPARPPTHVPA